MGVLGVGWDTVFTFGKGDSEPVRFRSARLDKYCVLAQEVSSDFPPGRC